MANAVQLYAASIAIVSGLYSLWSASMASRMVPTAWLMALLGVVVIVHGSVLLSGRAGRLGGASGPLMIGYAVLMLLLQALIGTGMVGDGSGMPLNGDMGTGAMGTSMGIDGGMVALATLMLISGVLMWQPSTMDGRNTAM